MSELPIQSAHLHMRTLSHASQIEDSATLATVPADAELAKNSTVGSFSGHLHEALRRVNDMQQESNDLQTRFEFGDTSVSLPQVMVAMNKSSLAFEATNQVRNRLLSAYQEIMSMQV